MNTCRNLWSLAFLLFAMLLSPPIWAKSDGWRPIDGTSALKDAQLEQRLGNQVPADLEFRSATGERVRLADYFARERPIILALGYVECPNLCTLVHQGMVHSLQEVDLKMGADFEVLSVSIDPREPLALTRSARQRYLQMYGRDGAGRGWHSLVGETPAIQQLADAIGYQYRYDAESKQYAHPGALIILTPEGRVSRYFYGVSYDPRDLRLALVDASGGRIGSAVDKVLLRCFSYDPNTGKYSVEIMRVVRWAGGASVLVIALGFLWAQSPRRKFSPGSDLPS